MAKNILENFNNYLGRKMNESVKLIADLDDYTPWSEAKRTWSIILDAGKKDEFEQYLEDLYPDGLTITELNDMLWFDSDQILRDLGLAEYPKGVTVKVTNIKYSNDAELEYGLDLEDETDVDITIEDELDDVRDLVLDALYDSYYRLSPGDIVDFDFEIDESCKNKKGKNTLKESREVSDEAYIVADKIMNDFDGKKFIYWDDFNDSYFKATKEVFGKEKKLGDDFEIDVRGILSLNGYATIYEGKYEGGLEKDSYNTDPLGLGLSREEILQYKRMYDKGNLELEDIMKDGFDLRDAQRIVLFRDLKESNKEIKESIITSIKKGKISLKELENANLTYEVKDDYEDDGHEGVELEIADKYGNVKGSIVTWDDGYSEVRKEDYAGFEKFDDLDDAVEYVVKKFRVDESTKLDDIDAEADNKKEKEKKILRRKEDDADSIRDERKKSAKKAFRKAQDDADADRDDKKRELKEYLESVDKSALSGFIKDSIEYFKKGQDGCSFFKLGEAKDGTEIFYVLGWQSTSSYDEEDVKNMITDDSGKYAVHGKIAINVDDLQSDYDFDWFMPSYEDGEVWDTNEDIDNDFDSNKLADEIIDEFYKMREFEYNDDGVIAGKYDK